LAEAFEEELNMRKIASIVALNIVMAAGVLAQGTGTVDKGHELFNTWCLGCHRAVVKNDSNPDSLVQSVVAGTYTLQQRYQGSKPAALEQRSDLDTQYIMTVVRHGLNLMPRTRKTELTDAEVADIAAYLTRNNRK
jgi:mono/diheme cytochrome c family protein